MQALRIADREVGPDRPCFVIAEAGVNHNGSIDRAHELIDAAVAAGADAVKFQTFRADRVVTRQASKAAYQKTGAGDAQTMYEMLKRLELSYDQFRVLRAYAASKDILFMSKGHKEDLDFLVEIKVPALKVDSAAVIYYSLLRKAAGYGLPVVLSTGACNLGEVERALDILTEHGNPPVVVLHCTTAYPAPDAQINLRAMITLRNSLGRPTGFSDHSLGIEIPIAAVAMGACMIEKHFTLDRQMEGPDHKASLEPSDLAAMIRGIRRVEAAFGDARKRPTSLERENMKLMRRSLVAERDIRAGERIAPDMVAFKRPGGGLGEDQLEVVIGRVAAASIAAGEPITWDKVGGPANG